MPRKLVRHGTNSGYRVELNAGNDPCIRCHNAHLVYNGQYTKAAKAKGIKYKADQVIDHLYTQGTTGFGAVTVGTTPRYQPPSDRESSEPSPVPGSGGTGQDGGTPGRDGPSLAERMRRLVVSTPAENEYVSDDEIPDYINVNSIDPDPDPDGEEYQSIPEDSGEYVINAAGMQKIEDSLGTYLSIVGITMEMVDPYCGPILAENMENIVKKWSKVIAKYPKAAELFMDGKGGTLMIWIAAIQATWPVLYAMYEHHFSKDVQVSGGQIFRKTGPNATRFDPTMPPMQDEFTYTAG